MDGESKPTLLNKGGSSKSGIFGNIKKEQPKMIKNPIMPPDTSAAKGHSRESFINTINAIENKEIKIPKTYRDTKINLFRKGDVNVYNLDDIKYKK